MITPRFSLTQDDSFLVINIRSPYCNLKELETYVENNDFRFICPPYYLRLNLPGNIIDNDFSSGQFLSETGEFIFKYAKVNKGEYFQGLDFITSLLTPIKKKSTQTNIEILSETSEFSLSSDQEGNEWHIEQKLPEENSISIGNICKYGFANQKFDILKNCEDEFYSVFDVKNADSMSLTERRHFRCDTESMAFCSEHFLADYFEDSEIREIILSSHPWKQLTAQSVTFSDKERDVLKDFPNREYILNKEELKSVLCGLCDILFAYCYDKRTTDFEGSCESGWTITKLSATFSWFDAFQSETETIISVFRRGLIYPLYRNVELLNTVLEDLKLLFNLGSVLIIKSLLDIYDIFNNSSDARYILNDLYIKDYIIFMQKCPKNDLEEMIKNVQDVKVTKEEVNLNLSQIIQNAIQGSIKGENILDKMAKLNMDDEQSDSSDSESDSDTSEDSSTDSDDSSSSDECDT